MTEASRFDKLYRTINEGGVDMLFRSMLSFLATMLLVGPAFAGDVSYRLETPGVK